MMAAAEIRRLCIGAPSQAGAWGRAAAASIAAQRLRWSLWLPVAFGAGIGLYFALPDEPAAPAGWAAVIASLALTWRLRNCAFAAVAAAGLLAAALGFLAADLRTARVAAPAIARATGVVEVTGRILRLSPGERGMRMVLAVADIDRLPESRTPARIRVTWRGAWPEHVGAGDLVRVRALLRPLPGPVSPGAFDFARHSYFRQVGALGSAVAAPEPIPPPPSPAVGARFASALGGLREALAARFRAAMPEQAAAVAVALTTGERGGIGADALEALRHSGLAHLLAISGLHMMLVGGFAFLFLRGVLTLSERVALTRPVRKWAALASLPVAAAYLLVSGAPVSAQRAFLMFGLMMLAVVLERRALSMRTVALAAIFVLALAPESLLEAGFQMSFAAVIALIAAYEAQAERMPRRRPASAMIDRLIDGFRRLIGGIALTTLIASTATAPFAAFHFQQAVFYALPANLLAMPLFTVLVMPFGLLGVALMPLGLEALPLTVMAWGIEGILGIARMVSGWPGAVAVFGAQPVAALVLMTLGGLWLCAWRGPVRFLGAVPAVLAVTAALAAQRPDILIDEKGALVAVRDRQSGGYFLSQSRPGFVARNWLEHDGDGRAPRDAAASPPQGWRCDERGCILMRGGRPWLAHVRHAGALDEDCGAVRILVSEEPVRGPCEGPDLVIGRFDLWRKGAHAVWLGADGMSVRRVRTAATTRPWSPYRTRLLRAQRSRPKARDGDGRGRVARAQ